jgi:SAM-dependent methyltransferase
MDSRSPAINPYTYGKPGTVAHYAALDYLTPCERLLFATYIRPSSAILDLGVGGGRTTPCLSGLASRYVGVDYVPAMVEACRAKFPGTEFAVADAADLSAFANASFDAVVFAFNGIDFVLPETARRCCLGHIHRVLKPGGVLIFSSHNARAIFVRPSWNRERLRRVAQRFSAGSATVAAFLLGLLGAARLALAYGQALGKTLSRVVRRLASRVLWRGEGCLLDSAHGGLFTHYSVPTLVVAEVEAVQLRCTSILGDDYPRSSHPLATDWYYYVFTKPLDQ